jgi:hypothetical protein
MTAKIMDLKVSQVIETKVGPFNFNSLNNLFYYVLDNAISVIINSYLQEGLNINWLIQDALGLSFIYLK